MRINWWKCRTKLRRRFEDSEAFVQALQGVLLPHTLHRIQEARLIFMITLANAAPCQ